MNGATIPKAGSDWTLTDRLAHIAVRFGIGRMRSRVAPGLYSAGAPCARSPVLVTANYKLTFDLLRREIGGRDAWILVLDTRGINVWCAAAKRTFSTDEIVRRVEEARLHEIVTHRKLILPQLGAPGVAAHEVRRRCGFRVIYGPVRARDIPAFLEAGMRATDGMRRVEFPMRDRLVLTPMELVPVLKFVVPLALLSLLLGARPSLSWLREMSPFLAAVLTGTVLTPALLPWIPARAFSLKGAITGLVVVGAILAPAAGAMTQVGIAAVLLLGMAISSYLAMNFTGSTTFTSPSGVEKEMRHALPLQIGALVVAVALIVGRRLMV